MSSGTGFDLTVNGRLVRVDGPIDANLTLLQFLRRRGLTGTKEGCAEGDCGACSVAIVDRDVTGAPVYRAINACITFLPMVAGRELTTVEGVGRPGELHPVQEAMVRCYGSQCGFCTPGFVVSMFEGYYRRDLATTDAITDQLSGNLCRCTGYRPIREAMQEALAGREGRGDDLFQIRLRTAAATVDRAEVGCDGGFFLRPATLDELLRLRAEHGDAELVAGATELGVYANKAGRRFPKLLSVEGVSELRRVVVGDDRIVIGAAAPLTVVEEGIGDALPSLTKMLRVFASRPIRNRATLGGNLVTASPIGDLAPVLLAHDATVTLASVRGTRTIPIDELFVAYRRTALAADEVLESVSIPRVDPTAIRRIEGSFKVSKRRELDISAVAAAFCLSLDEGGRVRDARLAFGGVGPTPMRARAAEASLVGRALDGEAMAAVRAALEGELAPISDHRGSAAYRKAIAAALVEKLIAGREGGPQDEPLSFERSREPSVAVGGDGRELTHQHAVGHVTGTALYVDDTAQRRSMLDAWPVLSRHARAKLLAVDTSAALKAPGVRAVLAAADVPGVNDVGAIRHDEPLFAHGELCFHGQLVALVVADSIEQARAAAALVEVRCEPLRPVLGVRAAIEAESFHTEPHVIARGDAVAALAAAPRRLAGSLEIGGQEHFYLEAHAAWAEVGDEGDVTVCSSTQHPTEVQAAVAHVLDLPRNRVVIESPRMGGGFGGKETQGNAWAAAVALAALRTGEPVRIQLDRDLDMTLTGKRHPFVADYEVGFDDGGKLLALRASLVSDGGWALDLSESICDRALFHIDNAYFIPNVTVSGRVAKTNTVSHTAFRGFGGPQGMVVIEEIMARVAEQLGAPPERVREANLYRGAGETNTTHYGQELGDERLVTIWSRLLERSEFAARRRAVDAFNAASEHLKRGLAITPVKFGISFTATFLNQAGALVLAYRDGTVQVNHGGTEMGQGLHTKIHGIAQRELGLTASQVRVMRTRTDKVPNTSPTAASSGSDLNGQAVAAACATLRARLAPLAAELLAARGGRDVTEAELRFADGVVSGGGASIAFAELCERAYLAQVSLSATGFYRTPGIGYDRARGKGKPFYYFAYGAAVSEVELDGLSGMKRVRRVDVLHDVGDSLNPGVDRGQVEGGFVQGMGWLTSEELRWTDDGRLATHSASTYAIPTSGDAPADFRVELLERAAQPGVIHGSKAVGEPPLMLAISVREALRDAVRAFGPRGGTVDLPCPSTHEALFLAVRARTGATASG